MCYDYNPILTTTYKMPEVLFTSPIKRSDNKHHPRGAVNYLHMLFHCTGRVFPDLNQDDGVGSFSELLEFDVLQVESCWMRLVPLKESWGDLSPLLISPLPENTQTLQSGIWRRALTRTAPFRLSDLKLPPSLNMRNTFLFFTRHPVYVWYFVIASWVHRGERSKCLLI